MKTASDDYASPFSVSGGASDGQFDDSLLGRIGDELRHVYGDVVDAELPRSLLDLVEAIDTSGIGGAHGE